MSTVTRQNEKEVILKIYEEQETLKDIYKLSDSGYKKEYTGGKYIFLLVSETRKDVFGVDILVEYNVYNREFRASGDLAKYQASRMSLADYISQHEKTKEMRNDLEPGKMIVWNPLTAEPTIVGVDDRRVSDSTWQYLNEVLVPKSLIPASELAGYHKAQTD